jgi:hypothetical protein
MEISSFNANPLDLTGQLTILDYIPKFTGNYSSVYLGGLNGNFVRFLLDLDYRSILIT